jgi:DNA adenine methylase
MTAPAPTRPVLRYHGGKWRLAPWIIAHFPAHLTYVEPFGGAGSVLMRKPRSVAEVYNDRDEEVVNLFRVLRDPVRAAELRRLVELTPYSRVEFFASYEPSEDPVERARRRVVRAAMAFGTTSGRRNRTGFRATPWRSGGATGVGDWVNYAEALEAFTARLRGVLLEGRPAAHVIEEYDAPDCLFYVDPPYPGHAHDAADGPRERAYAHELTDDDHRRLAETLHDLSAAWSCCRATRATCTTSSSTRVGTAHDGSARRRAHRADRGRVAQPGV